MIIGLQRWEKDIGNPEKDEENTATDCSTARSAKFSLSEHGQEAPKNNHTQADDGRNSVADDAEGQAAGWYMEGFILERNKGG